MPGARQYGWEWVLSSLWSEESKLRCRLHIPDTVMVAKASPDKPFSRWLFTSRSGTVSKKKDDNLTTGKIRRRFASAATSASTDDDSAVCTVYSSGNGRSHTLDGPGFDKLVNRLSSGNAGTVCALQACVPGRAPIRRLRVEYSRVPDGAGGTRPVYRCRIVLPSGSKPCEDGRTQSLLVETIEALIQHLQAVRLVSVEQLTADVAIDAAKVAWLTHVPSVACRRVTPAQAAAAAKAATQGASDVSGPGTPTPATMVPLLAMKRERERQRTASRGGDEAADDTDRFDLDEVDSNLWAQKSGAAAAGGGGAGGGAGAGAGSGAAGTGAGAASAKLLGASASLPLLREGETGVKCSGQFCSCVVQAVDTGVLVVRRPRNASRSNNAEYGLSNKEVLLARKCTEYITFVSAATARRVPGRDAERAAMWKEDDLRQQRELGARDPSTYYNHVTVCKNCHLVYRELAKHRARGFRSEADVADDDNAGAAGVAAGGRPPSSGGHSTQSNISPQQRSSSGAPGASAAGGPGAAAGVPRSALQRSPIDYE